MSLPLTDLFPAVTDWRHRSACRTQDPELWWQDDPNHARSELALIICGSCAVQADCLRYALDAPEVEGIWGGYTPKERRILLREQRRHGTEVA